MNFETWAPVYAAILADFGYDRDADERARDVLRAAVDPFDEARFADLDGATVSIAGGAPSIANEVPTARDAEVVIAASGAARVLKAAGVRVDVMITDLDKTPAAAVELASRGRPVVVHAHGDNIPAIREWLPRLDRAHVLGTTQAAPVEPVRNFGGFTDGDRAAFLADHFGAARLSFPGWDFDDPTVTDAKRRKLAWAERLLYWLETRRGDRFGVLDGRREAIDTAPLPIE